MRMTILMATLLFTAGCAQTIVETRVRSALTDAGLDARNARCMAERMVDRLTIDQLRKLERVKAREGERASNLSLADYVERVRRVGDAEVVAVTVTSAGLCATGLASEAG